MAAVASINSLGNHAFNPRGNLWLNDENRFGHKLLLKMGWNKGKGLGKNEDGVSENIRLNYKNDNLGVGFKDKLLTGVQDQEYDSILNNLNKGYSGKEQGNVRESDEYRDASLEKRSQKFRNRLHYQKFVRGKDVSRYSDKDMKSIFIVKKGPTDEVEPHSEVENSEDKHPATVNNIQSLMITYKSGLSVAEYFAKKLKDKSGITICNNFVKKEDVPSEQSVNSPGEQKQVLDSSTENQGLQKKRKKSGNSKKRKKLKLEKCKQLKSCLKLRTSGSYSLKKNVSFNEIVSYQIIDSDFTEGDTLQNAMENESLSNGIENDILHDLIRRKMSGKIVKKEILNDCIENEVNHVKAEYAESHLNRQMQQENQEVLSNNDSLGEETEVQEMDSTDDFCFSLPSLPKHITCNYNSWRESQKQALKMNSYKNMLKKIKKHPVLKTTNLLDIKGYGNWGF